MTYYAMLYKLCSCMYYKEMNSISFNASVQILDIVLCNYCTTCIIYRDKIKLKLKYQTILVSYIIYIGIM